MVLNFLPVCTGAFNASIAVDQQPSDASEWGCRTSFGGSSDQAFIAIGLAC